MPYLKKGLASGSFDDEGVATHDRKVVENGVVQGYFLSSYSGRKLGLSTTGNAGGNHNLILDNGGGMGFPALLKTMDKGLLVTELLGQGVNCGNGGLFAGSGGILGGGWRNSPCGRGNHHCGQPEEYAAGNFRRGK